MAGIKEIRTKIKSVQNTRKITKAMEMVAASKMRKAQDRMRAGRPYATKVRDIAAHLMHANPEYSHPFMIEQASPKAVGIVAVTTDKGLCGGLNTNIMRLVLAKYKAFEQQRVLSDWQAPPIAVHALTETRLMPAKARCFIQFLKECLS